MWRRGITTQLVFVLVFFFLFATVAKVASADDTDAAHTRAREDFTVGTALVKEAKWAEALAAFERSFNGVAHPVTLFNVGACERALGQYARARRTFLRAREIDHDRKSGTLPTTAQSDIDAFLAEIAAILVSVDVHLDPPTATIAVDGRPLEATSTDDRGVTTLTAGLAAPGPGTAPPPGSSGSTNANASFRLEIDPGAHIFVLARPGFQDIVRRETFSRESPRALDLTLTKLDGEIEVHAERAGAAVSVDSIDVGTAPITVRRPAGRYHVAVRKAGFVPFDADAVLEPGGRVQLAAPLTVESVPLTKRWWFWTAAGTVLVLATATTYLVTRPDPERPAANGGGLGWVLRAP